MALSQPVQDPFTAAEELLQAKPRPWNEVPGALAAPPFPREMVRRFMTLKPREFEVMLSELEYGIAKGGRLRSRIRKGQ